MVNSETGTPEESQEIEVAIRLRVPAGWNPDEIASKLTPTLSPFKGEVIECGPLSFRAVGSAAEAEPEPSASNAPAAAAADFSAGDRAARGIQINWPKLPKPPHVDIGGTIGEISHSIGGPISNAPGSLGEVNSNITWFPEQGPDTSPGTFFKAHTC